MEALTILTAVCGWCGCPLPPKNGEGEAGVSHGMCDACERKTEIKYLREDLRNMAQSHPEVCDGIYARALEIIDGLICALDGSGETT